MIANKNRVIKPDNLLLENSMGIFHLIMPLIGADRGASAALDLRAKFAQAFSEFERRCYEAQLDSATISDVKYAIAAFVDEKVMSSVWPNKLTWMGKPLQLEYFGDNLAGEGVYQKLSKLRQAGDRNIDALEVYYLCLQLGFEGMYRMRGLEQLLALQVDLRTQIADARNRVPRTLSPHGVAAGSFMDKVQRKLPYWVIAVVTLAVIFVVYLVFVLMLDNKADAARVVLQEDGQKITANLERDASQKNQMKFVPPVIETPPNIAPPPRMPIVETPKPEKVKPVEAPVVPKVATPPQVEVISVPPPPKPKPKPNLFIPIYEDGS